MAEKMLVTQALDERDLLVKKIGDKIANSLGHYGIFRRIIRELQSYGRKLLEDEGLFDIYGSVFIC